MLSTLHTERIHCGHLTYIEGQKNHQRWVILEKILNGSNNMYQLCLYKDDTEKHDKKSKILYINSQEFIGTEQGHVKTTKSESIVYFAVILVDETIMFQSSTIDELNVWQRKFKDNLCHKSWLIYPKEGSSDIKKKTLHVTQSSVCLAHLNPPRFYKRWSLNSIKKVQYDNDVITLEFIDEKLGTGFFSFSAEKLHYLRRIKEAIYNMKESEVNNDYIPPLPTPLGESYGPNSYVNICSEDNYKNVSLPPKPVPPARPIKDYFRHFRSNSIEETVYAIRSSKVCYRDSLQISPSQRHSLYVYMDVHEWWTNLADVIGLNCSEIDIVKSLAPRLNKFCTEILFYHWECMPSPVRECSIEELKKITMELQRPDLLSILENKG
ncbi:uncharacterized protein [Antedon mediterranea]|uniref:uncharacterized protein n=1 Tax=Antedon mediterranea TaxID=105859 RepID=UPI003AF7B04C